MSEDGHIDYSGFSLKDLKEASSSIDKTRYPKNYANLVAAIQAKELEDPIPAGPRVDIRSTNHSPPEISTLTFGPRCPACGWKKPVFMSGSKFNEPFCCTDCGSRLNITKIHRRLNAALMALFVPALAWFWFGGLEGRQKAAIVATLIFLAFLEYWFTRLEVVGDDTGADDSN